MGFFLISAPYLEKSKEATQREISQVVLRKNIVKGQQIFVERSRFKIANLDTLMFVNDKLLKLQSLIESFLKKLDKQYMDLNENATNQWVVKGLEKQYPIELFLNQFKWNDSKYPRSHPIPRIAQSFEVKLNSFDGQLRQKLNTFNEIRVQLSQITTKQGNYYTKDLTDLIVEPYVSSNDFCYGKFITTVVAIVPAAYVKDFLSSYEMFSNYVVPESAKQLKIPEKDGLTIWKINLFTERIEELDRQQVEDDSEQKNQQNKRKDRRHLTTVQQFIEKAREKMKIVVKQFKYTIGVSDQRKKKRQMLDNKLKGFSRNLSDTCKTFFSELYDMYMHAKVLRLIIETNMRFGTDPTLIYLLDTVNGKEKVVQSVLVEIFGDKENEGLYGTKDQIDDGEDFFPFVYVPLITL